MKGLKNVPDIIIEKDLCRDCAYYFGNLTCMAFPIRIPSEILTGPNDHKKPLPGQKNKIVFREGTLADLTPGMIPI